MRYEKKCDDQSEQILLRGRHPVFHGRGAEDRQSEIEYDERGKNMYHQIEDMKTPRCKTGQINVESESEICDEAERMVLPEFSEVEGPKETALQDVEGIIEVKRSRKSVGVNSDSEKQDHEKTGSCG